MSDKHVPYFQEYLVKTLKLCAQIIIDNAEEIIGEYKYTGDLNINITMDTGKSFDKFKYPEIVINKVCHVSPEKYLPIYDKLKEEEKSERKISVDKQTEKLIKENEAIKAVEEAQGELWPLSSDLI